MTLFGFILFITVMLWCVTRTILEGVDIIYNGHNDRINMTPFLFWAFVIFSLEVLLQQGLGIPSMF